MEWIFASAVLTGSYQGAPASPKGNEAGQAGKSSHRSGWVPMKVTSIRHSLVTTRQDLSDKTGTRSSKKVSTYTQIKVTRTHGQAWALAQTWLSWRPALYQWSSGSEWRPWTELEWTPGSIARGVGEKTLGEAAQSHWGLSVASGPQ